jgi:hypothetical protein
MTLDRSHGARRNEPNVTPLQTARAALNLGLIFATLVVQVGPSHATEPPSAQQHTLYKCGGNKPITDRFTPIMTVGRIFQLAFAIPGKLEPCVSISPTNHDQEIGEPAATIDGQYFIERTIGGPDKCMYILSSHDQVWEAMIAFDRLAAEYTIRPDYSGNVTLHVPGRWLAVCTRFHDSKTFRGRYPTSGQAVCFPSLEIGGPLFVNPAIMALRYVFSNVCPHTELRPY